MQIRELGLQSDLTSPNIVPHLRERWEITNLRFVVPRLDGWGVTVLARTNQPRKEVKKE